MNMILLHESEIRSETVSLQDFRAYHIIRVLNAEPGRVLKTGVLNRGMGTGIVTEIRGDRVVLKLDISSPPPPPAEAVLICALPRPKIFKKILYYAASMGIKEMHFINSWRVEKSFWKSPVFKPEKVRQITNEALAQSCDTIPPEVSFHRFFSEFAENRMPGITEEKEKVVCHPYSERSIYERKTGKNTAFCIGPEGGFIQREIDSFVKHGFTPVNTGPRILRVDNFVPALISLLPQTWTPGASGSSVG